MARTSGVKTQKTDKLSADDVIVLTALGMSLAEALAQTQVAGFKALAQILGAEMAADTFPDAREIFMETFDGFISEPEEEPPIDGVDDEGATGGTEAPE